MESQGEETEEETLIDALDFLREGRQCVSVGEIWTLRTSDGFMFFDFLKVF
jgi:hypothetical protein